MGFAVPRIYNHLFQDSVKFAYAHSVRGFYAEVYPNWGLDGPKLYAMARIVWDPNVDLDALMRDWNERMFREAAEPMRRYFALAEETWRKQRGAGAWAYRLAADPAQFRIFSPRVMERMTAYLDEAERLAVDETVRKRIQFFRKTWNLTRLLCGNYWAGERVQRLIDRKAPVERVAAAMREMADQLATVDVDRWMKENHISDDPIAFFPPLSGWFEPLKAGSTTNAIRYFASAVINDAMAEAGRSGTPDAAVLRDAIARRVDEVFGNAGSESYRETVARIRDMSLKVGTAMKLETPLKVDGLLDEAVWQKADVLTDFLKWGDTSRAEHVTKVRLARQGDNLYVGLSVSRIPPRWSAGRHREMARRGRTTPSRSSSTRGWKPRRMPNSSSMPTVRSSTSMTATAGRATPSAWRLISTAIGPRRSFPISGRQKCASR